MAKITFSHNYPKLWNQTTARLLKVSRMLRKNLHDDLIEYDTLTSDGKYYELPKGDLIQLVFLGNKEIPFCTIRPYTPEKFEYYRGKVGAGFLVIAPYVAKENELF